jgi:hypothetical protein
VITRTPKVKIKMHDPKATYTEGLKKAKSNSLSADQPRTQAMPAHDPIKKAITVSPIPTILKP